jgi:hypothetical protein
LNVDRRNSIVARKIDRISPAAIRPDDAKIVSSFASMHHHPLGRIKRVEQEGSRRKDGIWTFLVFEANFKIGETKLPGLHGIPCLSWIAASRCRILFYSRRWTAYNDEGERVQTSTSGVLQYTARASREISTGESSALLPSESPSESSPGAIDQNRPLVAPNGPPEHMHITRWDVPDMVRWYIAVFCSKSAEPCGSLMAGHLQCLTIW